MSDQKRGLDYIKWALEVLRDYHDTKMSSSEFLKKYNLMTDCLDNTFLRGICSMALRELDHE